MYPREHALLSGTAVLLSGIYGGLPVKTLGLWVLIGVVASVLIDLDHLPLAVVFNGKLSEIVRWAKRPVYLMKNIREFHDAIDSEGRLLFHVMISHFLILLGTILLYMSYPILAPAVIGIGVHVSADIWWNIQQNRDFPYI